MVKLKLYIDMIKSMDNQKLENEMKNLNLNFYNLCKLITYCVEYNNFDAFCFLLNQFKDYDNTDNSCYFFRSFLNKIIHKIYLNPSHTNLRYWYEFKKLKIPMRISFLTSYDKDDDFLKELVSYCIINDTDLELICAYSKNKPLIDFTFEYLKKQNDYNLRIKLIIEHIINYKCESAYIIQKIYDEGLTIDIDEDKTIMDFIYQMIIFEPKIAKEILDILILKKNSIIDKDLIDDFIMVLSHYSISKSYILLNFFFKEFNNISSLYKTVNKKYDMIKIIIYNLFEYDNQPFVFVSYRRYFRNYMSKVEYCLMYIDYSYQIFELEKKAFDIFTNEFIEFISKQFQYILGDNTFYIKDGFQKLVLKLVKHGNKLIKPMENFLVEKNIFTQDEINDIENLANQVKINIIKEKEKEGKQKKQKEQKEQKEQKKQKEEKEEKEEKKQKKNFNGNNIVV